MTTDDASEDSGANIGSPEEDPAHAGSPEEDPAHAGSPEEDPAYAQDSVPVHQRAILSVGLGVVAFLLLVVEPFGSLILSLPAITTGVHARREVLASAGAQRGADLAGAGLAIGGSTLLLAVVAVFLDLL